MTAGKPLAGDLDPIETASRDEISALQLARLKWSLRHTWDNVAPYRKKCEAIGVHPDDLTTLADLARFPFMTKADLRDHYPFGLFAVPRQQLRRLHASSGTTGKSIVVGYTQNDLDHWADLMARSIRAAGGRAGDMVHVAYGYGMFTGGLGAHYGVERLGCIAVPMSGGQTERQVQQIMDFRPEIIMVTPSYSLVIAEEFERLGIKPDEISLLVGLFGAEPWGEGMRGEIEKKLGIDAIDIYGLTEVIGPGVASECIETKDGPVIWEDHFYPEIIDPETGEVLPDGELGELVFTLADQGSLPGHPLPHARPDPPAAADGPLLPPHRQDHRPFRRHADHPRRQCLPDPDRGADPARPAPVRQLPGRRHPRRPPRQPGGALRSPARTFRPFAQGRHPGHRQ
jgi:phenylacetate-CoA ligase